MYAEYTTSPVPDLKPYPNLGCEVSTGLRVQKIEPIFLLPGNPGVGVPVGFVADIQHIHHMQIQLDVPGETPVTELISDDQIVYKVRIDGARGESAVVQVLPGNVLADQVGLQPAPGVAQGDRTDHIRRKGDGRVGVAHFGLRQRIPVLITGIDEFGEPGDDVPAEGQIPHRLQGPCELPAPPPARCRPGSCLSRWFAPRHPHR